MIVASQNFIRNKNDVSSVSLREIRRFNIFFEFFCDYLMKKKDFDVKQINISQSEKENYEFYKKISYKDIQIYSIILSIFVCYYLRIPENIKREELKNKLVPILSEYFKGYENFLDLTGGYDPDFPNINIGDRKEGQKIKGKNKIQLEKEFEEGEKEFPDSFNGMNYYETPSSSQKNSGREESGMEEILNLHK